jgi:hypothetical protein
VLLTEVVVEVESRRSLLLPKSSGQSAGLMFVVGWLVGSIGSLGGVRRCVLIA